MGRTAERLKKLTDYTTLKRNLNSSVKRLKQSLGKPVESVPVFVFGRQRSGTTMLMRILDFHPQTKVYNEGHNTPAFHNSRIRSIPILESLVEASKAPFVAFKPIQDTHRVVEILDYFPTAKVLWIYRDYDAVVRSCLKKFANGGVDGIRNYCEGGSGSEKFEERFPESLLQKFKEMYRPEVTDFELSALIWWGRNQLYFDYNLGQHPRAALIRYEHLIEHPKKAFSKLYEFVGMAQDMNGVQEIKQIERKPPKDSGISEDVRELCEDLMRRMDAEAITAV